MAITISGRPIGGLTGTDWQFPGALVDPYLVWADLTTIPYDSPAQVEVLAELPSECAEKREAALQWLVDCAEWTGRFPTNSVIRKVPKFVTGTVTLKGLCCLIEALASKTKTGDKTVLIDRFELASARFIPSSAMFNLLTRERRQAALDAWLPVIGSGQWTGTRTGVSVFVVDDFCNFGSRHVLAGLKSLWHQGKSSKPGTGAQDGRQIGDQSEGFWYDEVPTSSATNRGPGTSGSEENYGALLKLEHSELVALKQGEAGDELRVYRDYVKAPPSWSHGSAVMHAVAAQAPKTCTAYPEERQDLSAPSEMHFVQLPGRAVLDTSGGSLAGFAIDAIHRAVRRADADGRESVIVNLSYGTHGGPHDGSSMFERAMLDLLATYDGRQNTPVLHIVLPAGNTHLARCHANGCLTTQGDCKVTTLYWKVPPDDDTDSLMELWFNDERGGPGDVQVTVTPPCSTGSFTVKRGQAKEWREEVQDHEGWPVDVLRCAMIFPESPAQSLKGSMALVAVAPTMRRAGFGVGERYRPTGSDDDAPNTGLQRVRMEAPAGVWKIELTNLGEKAVCYHAWVQRDDAPPGRRRSARGYRGRQSYLLDPPCSDVDPRFTLNGIATATEDRLWVVGAMDERGRISRYSAAGPDRNVGARCEGPDVVTTVDGSRNNPGLRVGGILSGSRLRVAGTSIGAAVFTRLLCHALNHSGPHWRFVPLLEHSPPPAPHCVAGEPESADDTYRGWYRRLRCVHDLILPKPPDSATATTCR